MIIESVHIQNFKGIKDWNIEFKSNFNIIKGCNGKGKTSILEAIAVGLGDFIAGLEGVNTRNFSQYELRKIFERSGDGACTVHYEIQYSFSHYGLDVNTALQRFQGNYDLPEEVKKDVKAFYEAMDKQNYVTAKEILDKIAEDTATEFPLIVDMKTMYNIETGLVNYPRL